MLDNPDIAGSGFLASDELVNEQAERARRFRGTTKAGTAFTIGRAGADLFFSPDSQAHNLMSGLVDAGVQFVDPFTFVGSKAAKAATKASEILDAGDAFTRVMRIEDQIRGAARSIMQRSIAMARTGQAGPRAMQEALAEARALRISEINQTWDGSAFGKWWDTNWRARRLNGRIERFVAGHTARINDLITANPRGTAGAVDLAQKIDDFTEAAAFRLNRTLFGGKIDHSMALRLVRGERVKNVVGEAATRLREGGNLGRLPTDIRNLPGSRWRPFGTDGAKAYRVSRFRNLFDEAPQATLIVRGSPEDRYNAVKNVENYVRAIVGLSPEARERAVGAAARAFGGSAANPQDLLQARNIVQNIVEESLKASGHPDEVVRIVMARYKEGYGKLRTQVSRVIGENNGHDLMLRLSELNLIDGDKIMRQLAEEGKPIESLADIKGEAMSALIESELLNQVQLLPDPRKIRRLTQNPFWRRTVQRIYATKGGDQRAVFDAVEYVQNDIWKPLALMQPAYILRNLLDGQVRVWLSADKSVAGLFNHPFAYLGYVISRQKSRFLPQRWRAGQYAGILGEEFTPGVGEALGRAGESLMSAEEQYQRALTTVSSQIVGDAADIVRGAVATGDYVIVTRAQNPTEHTLGILDQLRIGHRDERVRLASRLDVADATGELDPRAVDVITDRIIRDPRQRELVLEILTKGYSYGTDSKRAVIRIDVPRALGARAIDPVAVKEAEDQAIRLYVTHEVGGRATKFTDIPELRVMMAHNRVPIIEPGMTRTVEHSIPTQQGKGLGDVFDSGREYVGVQGNPPFDWFVVGVGDETLQVIPVYKAQDVTAWSPTSLSGDIRGEAYSEQARKVVDGLADRADLLGDGPGKIPGRTGYMQRMDPNDKQGIERARQKWQDFTSDVFGVKFAGLMDKFEKNPTFRALYYRHVVENADLLSPREAAQLIRGIEEKAAVLRISPEEYVGSMQGTFRKIDNWKLLKDKASRANGTGTVEQLSEFSAAQARATAKQMFFDHASRLQYEDMGRVIAPFAAAWREVIGKYIEQAIVRNPTNLRRVERAFNGARKADPENDGTGFFERDPQTNQYVFNYPFSDNASHLLTGLYAPITAPVKGLSLGLALSPALGPTAQIPANELLTFVPKENDMRQFFLPYGSKGLKGFLPGWFSKAIDGVFANQDNMNSIYGQTYVETVRALYSEGGYNTADPDEREKLFQDAHGKARILTLMRAVNQAVGPATGTVKFEIDTKQGDVYIQYLIKQFQDLQQKDFETAVPEFIRIFGDEAMLYVSGKSRAQIGGLLPTEEFEEWAKKNSELMGRSDYKDVAGFLAPGGDEFSFLAWRKQTDRGQRVKMTGREVVDNAENAVGAAKFRAARIKYGPYPSREQRAWLRTYRAQLHKELPGFPEFASFDVGEFDNFIVNLQSVVSEPSVKNNQVAIATRIYLDKRNQAIAKAREAGLVGLKSRAATPLRDYLATIGDALVQKYPDFARVFEQKLQAELMQYEDN
jgi:hypothetical protein